MRVRGSDKYRKFVSMEEEIEKKKRYINKLRDVVKFVHSFRKIKAKQNRFVRGI